MDNLRDLEQQLSAEGYTAQHFLINALGDDVFCLIQEQDEWQVVYAERGFVREVLWRSPDQFSACAFMGQQVRRIQLRNPPGKTENPPE
jgi:hypothetical protein